MTVTVHDIDFASNQFRDWLHIVGTNGALTYKPVMVTPHGTNNTGGPVSGGGSSLALGLYNAGGVNVSDTDRAAGLGASDNTGDDDGDITISFAQPVTSVTLRYGNYPLTAGEIATGQQAYGISAVELLPDAGDHYDQELGAAGDHGPGPVQHARLRRRLFDPGDQQRRQPGRPQRPVRGRRAARDR